MYRVQCRSRLESGLYIWSCPGDQAAPNAALQRHSAGLVLLHESDKKDKKKEEKEVQMCDEIFFFWKVYLLKFFIYAWICMYHVWTIFWTDHELT